ncbi:MAG: hypothetical protein AAFR61_03895 [Bacteroidota bacterium]
MNKPLVNVKVSLLLASSLLLFAGCLQFRTLALYDGDAREPQPLPPTSVDQVVSPLLFQDDTLNIWGIVSDSCKSFELNHDVTYSGESSLLLSWNRQGCEWIGFGMGWDDYAGKNLEPLLPYAAFQMYVRTEEGKAFGLPMVFTLEDYSGVMAFCYTANKYFERVAIDEEWQKVVVPLKYFNDEGEGIDYTNIKQLQIEFQQAGKVFVDEITLVLYDEPESVPWMEEPAKPDVTALPVVMFDDAFINDNGWGLVSNTCQVVEYSSNAKTGSKAIHAKWNNQQDECKRLPYFGVSWTKWYPVDITPITQKASINFYLKTTGSPETLDFQILFEDFNRNTGGVSWDTNWIKGQENGWLKVEIPLWAFLAGTTKSLAKTANASDGSGSASFVRQLDPTQVKTLVFRLQQQGEFWIDQISLAPITNP